MNFFKRKEEQNKMANIDEMLKTLSEEDKAELKKRLMSSEQIEKAEENIAKKGADSQTVQDRIDESVGKQEEDEGDKDSQSAKDRVDEAMGEDKYLARKDAEEKFSKLFERLDKLEERLVEMDRRPKVMDKDESDRLSELRKQYLN